MIKRQGKDSTLEPAYLANSPKVTTFVEELPSVTAEDNGKVLSVVEGEWNKSTPTKGGLVIINMLGNMVTGWTGLDKTFAEIKALMADGYTPVVKWQGVMLLYPRYITNSQIEWSLTYLNWEDNKVEVLSVILTDADEFQKTKHSTGVLPTT